VKIEYDPKKSQRNFETRGLSFELVYRFEFATATFEVDERADYGEARMNAIGYIGQRLHHVTYTLRGDVLRVISLRKANPRETKRYAKT